MQNYALLTTLVDLTSYGTWETLGKYKGRPQSGKRLCKNDPLHVSDAKNLV